MNKIFSFLFILTQTLVFAQRDFEKRFFTINAESLPEVETFGNFNLKKDTVFISKFTLPNFSKRNNNYWQPVDMAFVMTNEKNSTKYKYAIPTLNTYNLIPDQYVSDGKTRVINTVQKNVFGLNILDTCPPDGICPRCAPYRLNNNF